MGEIDLKQISEIAESVKTTAALSQRIAEISSRFIGFPYREYALGGSSSQKETLTCSLKEFDCVTFVETVIAMALCGDEAGFLDALKGIRYQKGRVEWKCRNHFMSHWIKRNSEAGIVSVLSGSSEIKSFTTGLIDGIPVRQEQFKYWRLNDLTKVLERVISGDIIFFVSEREDLDIFHLGLLFKSKMGTVLRHASKTLNRVADEPLDVFLGRNLIPGVVIARAVGMPLS